MRLLLFLFSFTFILTACQPKKFSTVEPVPYLFWQSNSVQANGVRLHYWRTGDEAKPAMVLAHGITDFGLNWATFASKFEDEYDIIMYDARGHGFSEKPDGPYDLHSHMEDLMGLLGALGIQKPILTGHSMGGSIVALLAATYPDIPAAVILEDPPMEEALDNVSEGIISDWKAWVTEQTTTPKDRLIHMARTKYHPGWTDFEYDLWAESKRLVLPNVIDILQGDGFGNPREIFPKIIAPTLLLKADAKPENRERHKQAADLLPNGTLVHFDGAGHLIRHDKLAEMEQQVRKFLADIPLNNERQF